MASEHAVDHSMAGKDDPLELLLTNRMPGVTVDAPQPVRNILAQGRPRYVLSVNTGHAGSTSMSQRDAYEGEGLAEVFFTFENLGVGYKAWQEWWKKGHHGSNTEEVRRKVRDEYKALVDETLEKNHKTTYLDLGHHTVCGILHQIPSQFAPNVVVVRLRRDRYHTAFSLSRSGWHDICDIQYGFCPLRDEVVLHPASQQWSSIVWHKFGLAQQSLWYVDEVEAQWQTLVQNNPDLPRVECDWSGTLDFCFQAVARILKLDVAHGGQGVKERPHTKCGLFEPELAWLLEEDKRYQLAMGYNQKDKELIARVQVADTAQSLL
eukprot:CAMPEP_0178392786 /NCGR_PEP_ID=MMETSP0689_2-20121128/11857_1 /TAXON_ID=160604 /ORGANISM="Amphidinium massartii, Strain CS-259" /LENGTH=320 /DNA_ID=CAMNT_0020013369 /DNA_START=201 /DNA_END=1159 /DNA_ORIENTATION=-